MLESDMIEVALQDSLGELLGYLKDVEEVIDSESIAHVRTYWETEIKERLGFLEELIEHFEELESFRMRLSRDFEMKTKVITGILEDLGYKKTLMNLGFILGS